MEPAKTNGESHAASGGGFYHYLYRGQELLETGANTEARELFEDALALMPDHPEALAGLALSSFKLEDFRPASEAYVKLIELTPQQATLHVNLGIVQLKQGQLEAAEASFERASELGGDTPKIQNYLGLIYSKRGEYARALDAFRRSGSAKMAKQMETLLDRHRNSAQGEQAERDVEIMVNREVIEAQAAPAPSSSMPPVAAEALLAEPPPPPEPAAAPSAAEPDPDAERRRTLMKLGQRNAAAQPLSEALALPNLRTDAPRLRMPAENGDTFSLAGPGLLRARLDSKICAKVHGIAIVRGDLATAEPLYKKFKGRKTNVLFGEVSKPIHKLDGSGEVVWNSGRDFFHRLVLDGDKIFLNERVLFAFTSSLAWENGRITSGDLEGVHLVNFTGKGEVILRTEGPMTIIEVTGDTPLKVRADRLLGWRGRIAPRMEVAPESAAFAAGTPVLHMQGEGNLFVGAA